MTIQITLYDILFAITTTGAWTTRKHLTKDATKHDWIGNR